MAQNRRIEVEIIGSSRSLEAALGRSSASLTGFQRRVDRVGRSLTATGRSLTRSVTLPIVAAGAAATKMALDYDTAINHVQALTGASAKQTKQWSDQILKLAPRIGQSPQDLANALYFVASSGAKVNQVLPITAASARAAASGMGDAQTLAQLLTSAINAYGPKALSAARATDILTEAVKVGKAEPADLAMEIGKVIPVAQSMGVTFAEATTSVSELTNTGLDAAQAATGVRQVLVGLLKPASQTEKELHKLGLSAGELRDEVKEKGLNAALQDLARRVGDNKAAVGKLFPNVRALTAFLALTGKNAGQVSKALDQVEHSTGAAGKAFATAAKGPAFKLNQDLAELRVTGIKLGNELIPIVTRVGGSIADLAGGFSSLSTEEQNAILILAGSAAALGPVLTVFGNVAKVVKGTSVAMGAVSAAAGGEGLVASIAVAAPALAGIGVVAGLVGGAFYLASTSTDSLAGAFDRANGAVMGLQGSMDHLASAHTAAKEAAIQNTAAQLGVEQAQKTVNRIVKEGGKGTLAYKIALNQEAQAQQTARRAAASNALAHQKLRDQQKATARETSAAKEATQKLTTSVRKQLINMKGLTVQTARGVAAQGHFGEISTHNQSILKNAAGKFDALAASERHAADVADQHNNPALARTMRNAARANRATATLIQTLGRMPTHKEVQIAIITNRYTGATTGPPTSGRPGDPHRGSVAGATGAIVRRPTYSMIGEHGSEAVVPLGQTRGNSPLAGGNRLRFVIDDLDGMTGYIQEVAGGVVGIDTARRVRDRRMGR